MGTSAPFTFTLLSPSGPRLGLLNSTLPTPRSFPITRRGIIPHLYPQPKHPDWVMIPFESFLENNPPIPTIIGLRELTGVKDAIVHLTLRDPRDIRDMPANNKDGVNAISLQGVRKVTSKEWARYAHLLKPTVVSALPDTPFPSSNTRKRLTKSIERTAAWLADLVQPNPQNGTRLNVLCPLQGLHSTKAREAFSQGLIEEVHEKYELAKVSPHNTLDACLSGYILECGSLRPTDNLFGLLNASLAPLSKEKVRVTTLTSNPSSRNKGSSPSLTSPHEILALIDEVGIDLFDADAWAIECGEIGVGLDFAFPAKESTKMDIGHNLYLPSYTTVFEPLSQSCNCPTCAPIVPTDHILHSPLDAQAYATPIPTLPPSPNPHTKAYIHHLLQTHEMSAHSLLARHNMSTIETFFTQIRAFISSHSHAEFKAEIERFNRVYHLPSELLANAARECGRVEHERGRGRLAREKEKEVQANLEEAAKNEPQDIRHFTDLALEEKEIEELS